ncbi:hypothetical protein [Massilia sp. IC2-476]|uniref:hypothetical protein n=1 Tax=Massilia sp. IC2-476 TaxID=2887199 RepID=UPI001D12D5CC|nr:hypothetical protein [Massilia sp. IC2-476]MCC2973669.1 hypothetical protein [Massilia sp. IC2-476]
MHAHVPHPGAVPFGFNDYLDAVARLPAVDARPLSLRLHFPADASSQGLARYLVYLKREAAMQAVLLSGLSTVRQLGFEGLAPARLDECQLADLMRCLREHFRFMRDELGDYEVVLGLDGLAPERLWKLRRQGFNRLRIELAGVHGDATPLRAAAEAARAAGFRSVGVALGYGMPDQGFADLRRMLDVALAAGPDLVLLCHRPGAGRGQDATVHGAIAQRMQRLGSDRLDMAGYTSAGPERFALLPGASGSRPEKRPSPLDGTHLVGCGVAACGDLGAVRWLNDTDLHEYYARLDRNEVPVAHGRHIPQATFAGQTRPYLMQVKDFQDADQ